MPIARQFALMEKSTGQVVHDHVLIITKNPKYLDRNYVKVFVAFLEDVVTDERVAGKPIKLLLYMLQKLDFNTLYVTINPKEVMKELAISEKTFHRWRNVLIEAGYIDKIDVHTYRIGPLTAVKGSSERARENDLKHEANQRLTDKINNKEVI